MNRIILIIVLSLFTAMANAQGWFAKGNFNEKERSYKQQPKVDKPKVDSVAYYTGYVRINGWATGCGRKLSKEDSKHISEYLKFSKKNKAGHWTCVESFSSRGKRVANSQMGTYLVNPNDDSDQNADSTWREKLKEVVRWQFIGDETGENCIQEKAYNDDNEHVYTFIVTPIGSNKFMGHYTDAWGEPIRLRSEAEANYVIIERDHRGFETSVAFIGEDGYPQKNRDGAYISKYTYDNKGNMTSCMSCDVDGSYMIDNYGNCGQRYTYNDFGDLVFLTNYNEKNEVMRVNSKDEEPYISKSYKRDRYGRMTACYYTYPDGMPDTLSTGIHCFKYTYNDYGDVTMYAKYDINGKLRGDYSDDIAIWEKRYDKDGHMLTLECRNQDGLLDSLREDKYEGSICIESIEYKSNDGVTKDTIDIYTSDGRTRKRCDLEKNSAWMEMLDEQGRIIEDGYYDSNWNPIYCRSGYHKRTWTYTAEGKTVKTEMKILDKDGNFMPLDSISNYTCNHSIVIYDSTTYVIRKWEYNGDRLLYNYVLPLSKEGSNYAKEQYGMDINGSTARTHYADALYYKSETMQTVKEQDGGLAIVNEYGEPAYAMTDDSYQPRIYSYFLFGGEGRTLDDGDEGRTLDDKGVKKGSLEMLKGLMRACVIEIYNNKVNNYGLQSGDVIMRYGDWAYSQLETSETYPDSELRLETFLKRNEDKQIVVMRRDEATNKAIYKIIDLPVGQPHDFGFIYHYIFYADRETQRYNETFASYKRDLGIADSVRFRGIDVKDKNELIFTHTSHVNSYMNEAFQKGMLDDAIVLGMIVEDSKGDMHVFHAVDSFEVYRECWSIENIKSLRLWYTHDLKEIKDITFETNSGLGLYSNSFNVPDSLYQDVLPLAEEVDRRIKEYVEKDASAKGGKFLRRIFKLLASHL